MPQQTTPIVLIPRPLDDRQEGWEAVADYAIDWATRHISKEAPAQLSA